MPPHPLGPADVAVVDQSIRHIRQVRSGLRHSRCRAAGRPHRRGPRLGEQSLAIGTEFGSNYRRGPSANQGTARTTGTRRPSPSSASVMIPRSTAFGSTKASATSFTGVTQVSAGRNTPSNRPGCGSRRYRPVGLATPLPRQVVLQGGEFGCADRSTCGSEELGLQTSRHQPTPVGATVGRVTGQPPVRASRAAGRCPHPLPGGQRPGLSAQRDVGHRHLDSVPGGTLGYSPQPRKYSEGGPAYPRPTAYLHSGHDRSPVVITAQRQQAGQRLGVDVMRRQLRIGAVSRRR